MKKHTLILLGILSSLSTFNYASYEIRYGLSNIKFVEKDEAGIPVEVKPKIESFLVNNESFELNSSVLLSWAVSDATHVYIKGNDNSSGLSTAYNEISGTSLIIQPTASGSFTYSLKAVNASGTNIEKSINVTVTPYNYPEPIITAFTSQYQSVFVNSPLVLNWDVKNYNKLQLKSDVTGSGVAIDYSNVTGNSQTITPTQAGNYQYSLKAINLDNEEAEKSVGIMVEAEPTLENLVANPTRFRLGTSTSLTFEASTGLTYLVNGVTKSISGNTYSYSPTESGIQSVSLKGSKTLNGVTKDASKSVQIEVIPKDFILSTTISTGTTYQLANPANAIVSSSILTQNEGKVSGIAFQVANYKNSLSYNMTMTACAGSNCVTSPTYNTINMQDNLMNTFSFATPLVVAKGQTIQYTIQMLDVGKNGQHPVFYAFNNPPASISNYVTPLFRNGSSTGVYTDIAVYYQ